MSRASVNRKVKRFLIYFRFLSCVTILFSIHLNISVYRALGDLINVCVRSQAETLKIVQINARFCQGKEYESRICRDGITKLL